ncbi:MAG: hypothetical protein BWY57_02122 [Betaproteobacteria bacterium ADurb.Bin341]|nr:MAG: hypothetical protein BWY57_02122 [Betaproteobacteria bacterium ADurb.Bin341]
MPAANQVLGDFVHRVEAVGRAIKPVTPVKSEPADILLDVLGIFIGLLGRIRIVHTQMTPTAELLRHAEIDADRLGVSDVDIAVGLRRKTRHHVSACPPSRDILGNPLLEKMPAGIRFHRLRLVTHDCSGLC